MSAVEYPLPKGWRWETIGDVTSYVQRGKSPKYAARSDLPVVNQKCVRWHGVEAAHLKFIDESQWEAWPAERTLQDGDVLWNSTGTGTIGRAALYRPLPGFSRVVADSHVTVLRSKSVLPEYLHNWIRSPVIQGRIDEMQTGSTNQVELARSEVLNTRIPVPPIKEQTLIVAKLAKTQANSRRTREALDAVPPLLEKLRQSILAAAFRGDLTKDWRAKHKDAASGLAIQGPLRGLGVTLNKTRSAGKDRRDVAYGESARAIAKCLSPLPHGWRWVHLGDVAPLQPGYAFTSKGFQAAGVRLLKGVNVRDGWICIDELHYWNPDDVDRYEQFRLRKGDVVLAMDRPVYSSGSRATKVARLDESWEGSLLLQRVGRFQTTSSILSGYLVLFLNSSGFRDHIIHGQKGSQDGKDLPHVSAGVVDSALVALPPLDEQAVVAENAARQLAALASLRAQQSAAAHKVSRLEASVLSKAFRGELVAQDPNDTAVTLRSRVEPAPPSTKRASSRQRKAG